MVHVVSTQLFSGRSRPCGVSVFCCCVANDPRLSDREQQTASHSFVSVGLESSSSLAGWFWLRDLQEAAVISVSTWGQTHLQACSVEGPLCGSLGERPRRGRGGGRNSSLYNAVSDMTACCLSCILCVLVCTQEKGSLPKGVNTKGLESAETVSDAA